MDGAFAPPGRRLHLCLGGQKRICWRWTELPTSSCVAGDGDRSRTSQLGGTEPTGRRQLEARGPGHQAEGKAAGTGSTTHAAPTPGRRGAPGHALAASGSPASPGPHPRIARTPPAPTLLFLTEEAAPGKVLLPRAAPTPHSAARQRPAAGGPTCATPSCRAWLLREPFTCFRGGKCPALTGI